MNYRKKYLKYKTKYLNEVQKYNHDYLYGYVGYPNQKNYAVCLHKVVDGKVTSMSFFHDVPLWHCPQKGIAHMVVEIPAGTNYKLEINKKDLFNPIKYDIKNNKIRKVALTYSTNYGALPQTWENPNVIHPLTQAKGDNDPIDAMDISTLVGFIGQIKRVKILGIIGLIDEDETDWKVICIDINDPLSKSLNDIDDVRTYLPNKLDEIYYFLRDYKIPDGKPPNIFALNGQYLNKQTAVNIIQETHHEWEKLISGQEFIDNISVQNSTITAQPTCSQD